MKLFLIILLLLIGILLIPVRIFIKADPDVAVSIGYLFFRWPVLPQKDRPETTPKKPKKEKKEKPKAEKKKKKLNIQDLKPYLGTLLDVLSHCFKSIQKLLKRTTLARLTFEIKVVGEDAAAVAMQYGRVSTAVYNAVAMLDRIFTLRVEQICILPDFTGDRTDFRMSLEVRVIPLAGLLAGLNILGWSLFGLVKIFLQQDQDNKKKAVTQERDVENGKQPSNQ